MSTLLNWNQARIVATSFLAYFLMSAVISPLGLVSGPIAETFSISITEATAAFTYLTSGILVGTLVAIFIFDYFRLKHVVAAGAILIAASLYLQYAFSELWIILASLAMIGAACGIELSAAAVVITKSFATRVRASMLLLTDSFYSGAGIMSTAIAGNLLAKGMHWSSAYFLAFTVAIVIVLLALMSRYPATAKRETDTVTAQTGERWPLGVHLIGLAMLIYLIGFVSIYSWVPNYAQTQFNLDVESSGTLVSRFFLGMFVGQLIMFFLVFRFALRSLVTIYAVMATVLTAFLWTVGDADSLRLAMTVLGLVTGGLFKTILTYGTTLVASPSPKMISYLIFHGGLGTAVTPFVTAVVVEHFDVSAALKLVTLCYAATIVLILFTHALHARKTSSIEHDADAREPETASQP